MHKEIVLLPHQVEMSTPVFFRAGTTWLSFLELDVGRSHRSFKITLRDKNSLTTSFACR